MKIDTHTVDITNARRLTAQAAAAVRGGDAQLDLSAVQKCDSSAVAMVLECLREARIAGVRLRLAGVPADLLSLARLYGVEELLQAAGAA